MSGRATASPQPKPASSLPQPSAPATFRVCSTRKRSAGHHLQSRDRPALSRQRRPRQPTGAVAAAALSAAQHRRQHQATTTRSRCSTAVIRTRSCPGSTRHSAARISFTAASASQSTRASNANLFGFTDTYRHPRHQHQHQLVAPLQPASVSLQWLPLQPSPNRRTPYFAGSRNVSGDAGIAGNNQEPDRLGTADARTSRAASPRSRDAQSAFNRSRTDALSASDRRLSRPPQRHHRRRPPQAAVQRPLSAGPARHLHLHRRRHTERGNKATVTGSDLADFLLGVPDTSSIAFGNADKYLRQPVYDAYATDDWRVRPTLTINAGVRWEYGAPITELRQPARQPGRRSRLHRRRSRPRQRSARPTYRQPLSHFAPPSRPARLRAAHRRLLAAHPRVHCCRSRRLRHLSRHLGLPVASAPARAASPTLEEPQRAEQRRLPAHARQRLRPMRHDDVEHLCRRSELPRRLRADLAARRAARPPLRAPAHRHLPRRQRHARRAAVSAEHLPHRRRRTPARPARPASSIEPRAATPRARPACFSCAAGCAAASPPLCSTPTPNPSTTTPCSAARATSQPRARQSSSARHTAATQTSPACPPSRRTGSTFAPSEPFHLRSAPSAQPAAPVHQRPGSRRRNPDGRLARQAAQGMDRPHPNHRRHRPAGDPHLSRRSSRHGLHRHHPSRPDRRRHLRRPHEQHLNAAAYTRPCAGPMGNRGPELDQRTRPVHPQRLARPHLPPAQSLQPRRARGRDQPPEPCRLHRLEHDREQHAVRPPLCRQSHAQPCKPRCG